MTDNHRRLLYVAGLIGLFAAVAAIRGDLVAMAFRTTLWSLEHGSPAFRLKIVAEVILFGAILLLTLRIIPSRVDLRRDAAVFVAAAIGGWIAEAWGTRTGLWEYYTGETPPLWIVPAWPLGALVIDRASRKAGRAWPSVPPGVRKAGYWAYAAAALAVFVVFSLPAAGSPWTWLVFGGVAASILAFPRPRDDFWIIAAGLLYISFADLWGTSNNCWTYHIQSKGSFPRLLAGVSFGMLFDTAVVLGSLKLARLVPPEDPGASGG